MRVRLGAGVMGVLALALAGCAGADVPDVLPATAAVRATASCLNPEVLAALGLELDPSLRTAAPTTAATRGLPPEGFVADSVLVCDRGETLRDSAGTWWSVTTTRLEGDLGGLVDEVVTAGPEPTCGPVLAPQVWLVDVMGEAVLLPSGAACPAGVADALAGLEVVERTEHPVALTRPTVAPAPAP